MIILQNVSTPKLMGRLRKICLDLDIEYLQDADLPKNVDKIYIWNNPPDISEKKLKDHIVSSLIFCNIINEPISRYLYERFQEIGVSRAGAKVKYLILSKIGLLIEENENETLLAMNKYLASWQIS